MIAKEKLLIATVDCCQLNIYIVVSNKNTVNLITSTTETIITTVLHKSNES